MSEMVSMLQRLEGVDLAVCGRDDLDGLVAGSARVRAWLDAFDIRVAARNRELTGAGREANTNLMSNKGRRSSNEAREAAARADTCEAIPELGDALANGDCSAGHVDAVTKATAGIDDATRERVSRCGKGIAAAAKARTPEQLGREVRDLVRNCSDDGLTRTERLRRQRRVKRWVSRETGMHITQIELDPETDAKLKSALDAGVAHRRSSKQDDGLTLDQLQADAVIDLILNGSPDGAPARPEITVLIDWITLTGGIHERSVCETGDGTALPVEAVRRMCCDADIVPAVLGGAGEVLDLGRSRRTASRAQRQALRAMHRHCAFPGCTVGFDQCRIHHVIFWWVGGGTDVDNLVPVCEQHHHAVHEGGYTLELLPGRHVRITAPDGTVIADGLSITRTPTDTFTPPRPAPDRPARRDHSDHSDHSDRRNDGCDHDFARLSDIELVDHVAELLADAEGADDADHRDDPDDGRGEPEIELERDPDIGTLADALTIALARGYLHACRDKPLPDDVTAKLRAIHHRRRRAQRADGRRPEPARPAPSEQPALADNHVG